MKKLQKIRIKDKKQFKRAITIILLTIVSIVLVTFFMENLKINGFGSLFTIPTYKEAFSVTEFDIKIINLFEKCSVIFILLMSYINLDYYSELAKIEREEEIALQNI